MKKLLVSVMALITAAFVFAEGSAGNAKVKQLVNPAYYDKLIAEGIVTEKRMDGSEGFLLLPETIYSEDVKGSMVKKDSKNFPYTYESLYFLNKKDLLTKSNSSDTEITMEDVARVVRSVSKMQGMKYYSTTHKKEMVLYSKAYMIAGPKDKTKIEDQNTGNADGQISYCIQHDNSFGLNTYKLYYFQKDDSLLCRFEIIDKMGIGPFKAIYPSQMIINILVVDCGDDLLLYLSTDLDAVRFPGIKKQITNSMESRMDAVYKWFITQF